MECASCLKEVPKDSDDAIHIEHGVLCGAVCEEDYMIKVNNTIEAVAQCIEETISAHLSSAK